MRSHEEFNDKKWPPGTVLLEGMRPHPLFQSFFIGDLFVELDYLWFEGYSR